jgi:hypothetical protein
MCTWIHIVFYHYLLSLFLLYSIYILYIEDLAVNLGYIFKIDLEQSFIFLIITETMI